MPAFATSVAIGRWGCFYSGLTDHTHGCPTTLSWGHDFGDHISRHPVQLYESAAALLLCGALLALQPRWRRDGTMALSGFAGYAVLAFGLQFLRADSALVANDSVDATIGQKWLDRRKPVMGAAK